MEAAHLDFLGGVVGIAPDDGLALLGRIPAASYLSVSLTLPVLAADFFKIICRWVRGRGRITAVLWIVLVWLSGGRHPFAADLGDDKYEIQENILKRIRDTAICISFVFSLYFSAQYLNLNRRR